MPWPTVVDQPLNEYQTPFLATMAFPTLFPDGKGDPTNQALTRDVTLLDRIRHLIKYAEKVNGKWFYRFASHPRFSYWAFNMNQRKRTLEQKWNLSQTKQPPDLSIAVMVKFDDYRGPSFSEDLPLCVPVCPITVSSHAVEGIHERQQLPLRLAYALTIHKSQGLTLSKAWVNIGKSEKTPGISYVAISRVKKLTSLIIEPMTFERLTSIKSSLTLQFRLLEESRLDNIAQSTSISPITHNSHY